MSGPWRAGESLLALVIIVGFAAASHLGHLEVLEGHVFSTIARLEPSPTSDDIVIIGIDEASLNSVGTWPWRRSVIAELINRIAAGQPKAIATTLTFDSPENDPALEVLEELTDTLAQTMGSELKRRANARIDLARNDVTTPGSIRSDASLHTSESGSSSRAEFRVLERGLGRLRDVLDGDRLLADAIDASGSMVLGLRVIRRSATATPEAPLPRFVAAHVLAPRSGNDASIHVSHPILVAPIAALGRQARDLGTLPSSGERAQGPLPLVEETAYGLLPSVPLLLATRALNGSTADIDVRQGEGVRIADLTLPTDEMFRLWTAAVNRYPPPLQDSAADLLSGRLSPERYRDRVVLIGPTVPHLDPAWRSLTGEPVPPVIALAQMTASLLHNDTVHRPHWGQWVELGVLALIGVYLLLALPRMRPGAGMVATGALALALAAVQTATLLGWAVWLQLGTALLMLLTGHLVLVAQRGLRLVEQPLPESAAIRSTGPSQLTRRQIAQLDESFDHLQRVPLNDAVMEQLYRLGTSYQSERMPRKALAVFRYLAAHNPRFRDVKTKIGEISSSSTYRDELEAEGQEQAGENGSGARKAASMLGRYRIERELGQGAMGIVYLGTDSRIGRTVAIKTMALSEEFSDEELRAVKERFFREAETAGRLNHPNIVTIYDVGEQHDLAYIAMEYLGGRNLGAFTRMDKLLPLAEVLEIIAKCADTLAFAHARNVVHRDIKPTNVMFEPVTGGLKITDFGIARVTDSSKTKRGMVLGTPSYMSPEQLSGQSVDGRSDLFSLGIMLFQMSTGQLPFSSDSMASLMYKIANEAHPPLRALRTDAPPCLQIIVDKALAKRVESRYQSGSQMAQDLRDCSKKITM